MKKNQKILKIAALLNKKYPPNNLGNKKNPLNEYLYILISLRTTGSSANRTYLRFKKEYPKWQDAYEANIYKISITLKNAGLSFQKANNLKKALIKIKKDFGKLSLSGLKCYKDEYIEKYLISLPGVGIKSARCIMMYSFGREVFPVDSHCFRIIKRLGWIDKKVRNNIKNHNFIQNLIPLNLRYNLHVNLIQHGRNICFPYKPRCNSCFLNKYCYYYKIQNRTKQKYNETKGSDLES